MSISFVLPRVLESGLWLLAPGTERYRVTGGGATALALNAGDRIEIIDPEGRQQCELSAFDADGVSDPGLLGASTADTNSGNGTRAILSAPLTDARRVRAGLERQGIDLSQARPALVFEADSPADSKASFTAVQSIAVVVAAPGGPMNPQDQNPPTDLIVYIYRASLPEPGEVYLPAPLADPTKRLHCPSLDRESLRSPPKATTFQVVDVEGRQCSDFQCFAVSDLEQGKANCLDGTITRTLMGSTCPGPGLYSKFYNADMQPLVEVLQDTVGRHDTFNTACNSRYYEEMGFPGHVNCTDNINTVWSPLRCGGPARLGSHQLLLQHPR